VSLVVCEPNEAAFYHYDIMQGWRLVSEESELRQELEGSSGRRPDAGESGAQPGSGGPVREGEEPAASRP
jgi:hypothetical protein